MIKGKADNKKKDTSPKKHRGKAKSVYSKKKTSEISKVEEMGLAYGSVIEEMPIPEVASFKIIRGGQQKEYTVSTGYGYFLPSFKKAKNKMEVSKIIENELSLEEIEPIIDYCGLKVSEIAKAAAVSPSTVSRWGTESSIGVPGSNQFYRIDQVIRKGVGLFGGLEELDSWLHSPNLSLGNTVPAKLMLSMIGVELVDEALDALHYGNVM